MLKDFHLKNFRCFKDTKISGFERVNLIGGKNNSGKTALLEALFLYVSPEPQTVLLLKELRNEFLSINKEFPEITWESFFFNKNKENIIELIANNIETNPEEKLSIEFPRIVTLKTNDSEDKLTHSKSLSFQLDEMEKLINKKQIINSNYNTSILSKSIISHLYIESNINIKKNSSNHNDGKLGYKKSYRLTINGSEIEITNEDRGNVERQGFYRKILQGRNIEKLCDIFEKKTIFCSSSFSNLSNRDLAQNFDIATLNNQSEEVLNVVQKLDSTIVEIRTLTIGEPNIYLRRKDENFLPISLFGDCFNRVLDIILKLISNKNSVCLIDEIENGIHYQNQREFWRSLFKLAIELDTQIFATTHSLEMMQAFADVGLEFKSQEGAYFELARNEKNNEIVGIKRDLELLQYSLKHEEGVGLRGE